MSSSGKKPNEQGPKYAVAKGRETGIFDRWGQAHSSTDKYPSNIHQKLPSRDAAEEALSVSGPSNTDTGPYYAVRNGRNPGIYRDWKSRGSGYGGGHDSTTEYGHTESCYGGRETDSGYGTGYGGYGGYYDSD
ncbi:uncharacterized protein DFL_003808 [Arthrobotrys flagrans]|uniref:Ribonuclease H1 N-terminal domain-containing protein n=1 Tax=Arthrobotrys flagrans TaxID=97331 RepID=A0A437A365_ARTFL|nr:hypothetical protein DFL_003808 [Arthrobotrys flagrans]